MQTRGHTAVMAQRHEPHDSLDFFPTPPWATRAICEKIIVGDGHSAWEPACGEGHMARPMQEYCASVFASDVFDYGFGDVEDFLLPSSRHASWIITNPPFRLASQFISTAMERASCGVAMLVRTAFLESADRYFNLFAKTPPSRVYQFVERVPMHRGRLVKGGSTATAYCWLVWHVGHTGGTEFHWIAPCRSRLERASDYAGAMAA